MKFSVEHLTLLYETLHTLTQALEESELFYAIQKILPEKLDCQEFSLLLLDETREVLEVKAAYGFTDNRRILGMQFQIGEGISGQVALGKKTIYIPDTSMEPRYLHYKGHKKENGSFVSLPLLVGQNFYGVLNIGHAQKNAYSEDNLKLLETVAGQISLVYDRSRLYMKTKELSITDELTGLNNRRHFQKCLKMEFKRASRFHLPLSLLMIDVDYFKKFNDAHGHLKGDCALRRISELLTQNVREIDCVARFGGEEFVILLLDSHMGQAVSVAEKIRAILASASIEAFGLTVSIGVSSFPDCVDTEEELINTADLALYKAKDKGRNQVVAFEDPKQNIRNILTARIA